MDGERRSAKLLRWTSVSYFSKLDEELVAELEAGGEALSSQVNDAVRNELARRRRQRLLGEMLEQYERTEGPPDEALVVKYMDLLA